MTENETERMAAAGKNQAFIDLPALRSAAGVMRLPGSKSLSNRAPKDVIKSGGEWISSIDLENAAVAHPAVAMAAVIGVKHPKWDERPLLFIVRKPGQSLDKTQILDFLAERVAKWWLPDEVLFVESLPLGGTGKVQKNELRQRHGSVFGGD